MRISKVISGAQTGADRGGLDAAMEMGIPCGGWCPKGRRAEDGVIPEKYPLKETSSSNYPQRTEFNILTSDCTVVFTMGKADGGSWKTIHFANNVNKPVLHVDLDGSGFDGAVAKVSEWLCSHGKNDMKLNVAGNRESKAPGIEETVRKVVSEVLRRVNA